MAAINLQWWAAKNLQKSCIEIHGIIPSGPNQLQVLAQPLITKAYDPKEWASMEGKMSPPVMELTKESAQSLMDELWSTGIRPSNGAGNVGELAAVREHLNDMREMVKSFMELKK